MVMTIKKGEKKEKLHKILKEFEIKKKGIDAYKFCGVITLTESPLEIQKQLRSEWE